MFDFAADHSLVTVPSTWVRKVNKSETKMGTKNIKTKCYWPKKGSNDELHVSRLIKICSAPNIKNWDLLDGVFKGFYKSQREGDAYITEKLGTCATSPSSVTDIEQEKLDFLEKKAALSVKEKSSKNKNEKYRPSPRTLNDMTSPPPTPNIPQTPMSQIGSNPGPSTSYSTPGMHYTVMYLL